MPLFPWMDKEKMLSEVYTEMEMEEYKGRGRKKTVVPLNDCKDLFKNVKPQGTRILVKGDPGTGKTTFVQKLAFDWATKHLVMFDVVLVVKLKFADKSQSIASMVKGQIETLWEDDRVSEEDIAEYMRSGRDRVLLVLDGLDEINLKQYPQVQEVLVGERYRKCCILATTRPHVAETLHNKMTTVAKIKGFSREQAKQFVGNILVGNEFLEFFRQLDGKKMSQMYRVPLVVQALALLFREYKKLPRSHTITYDELVLFLNKSCKQSKDLTEEEIQAAMDEVSQLAFEGLIREDRKLVFSRDEIKDDNVRKLGILTTEKAGSGFRPTEVLQFVHKTVQEHSASDHVVKRLLSDDREPWEALVEQFRRYALSYALKLPDFCSEDKLSSMDTLWKSALRKIVTEVLPGPGLEKELTNLYQNLAEAGLFDEEIDFEKVSDVFTSHPFLKDALTEEEKTMLVPFLVKEMFMKMPKKTRLGMTNNPAVKILSRNMIIVKDLLAWAGNYVSISQLKNALEHIQNILQPHLFLPEDGCKQYFGEYKVQYDKYKTLFSFICGKLADHPALRDAILQEMAVLLIQHSFDANNGGVLKVNEILSLVWDLKSESLPDDYSSEIRASDPDSDPFLVAPALVYLRPMRRFPNIENLEPDKPCALKIHGIGANISEFIPKVTSYIRHLKNIHVLELQWMDHQDQDLSSSYQEFMTVLSQSYLVSVELGNVDSQLVTLLMQNLPLSVKRLALETVSARGIPKGSFTFPPEVHLVSLQLENCHFAVDRLFRNTTFPNLITIASDCDIRDREGKKPQMWTKEDIKSLLDAVRAGRIPVLKDLEICNSYLKGCSPELVEILKAKSFRSAHFSLAELSREDGHIFLSNIDNGNLDHIEFLSLIENVQIELLGEQLKTACEQHEIHLNVGSLNNGDLLPSSSPETLTSLMAQVLENHVAPAAATGNETEPVSTAETLVPSFTTEQIQNTIGFISSLTQEQRQSVITFLTTLTPGQTQDIRNLFSSFNPKQAQTLMILISNLFQNQSSTLPVPLENPILRNKMSFLLEEYIGKDAASAIINLLIKLTPATPEQVLQWELLFISCQSQAQSIFKLLRSFHPEQRQTMIKIISSFSPEQKQTVKTIICSLTSQQLHTVLTQISRINPETTQTIVTLISTVNPEQLHSLFTLISRLIPGQGVTETHGPQETRGNPQQKRQEYLDDLDLD